MSSKPEHIGDIAVDSGEILVIDPDYTRDEDLVLETDDEDETQLRFTHGGAAAVRFATGCGDGVYPVFVHVDGRGDPTHVVISLDGEEH